MRDQRETPRDILRALSKTLAPKSNAISTSSSSSPEDPSNNTQRRGSRNRSKSKNRRPVVIPEDPDDSDDEFPIDKPRFSLPIDEEADSDGDLPRPPRSSGLEDLEDNFTMQSIELPRRSTLTLQQRYSIRMSDYGLMNDPQSDNDDVGIDSAFFPRTDWAEDTGDGTGLGEEDDATLERLDEEAGRRETLGGRISDFGAIDFNLDDADQSTVILAPQVQSSPNREGFSPENEPFGLGDESPPPNDEMEIDDNALPDITGGEDEDIGIGDLSTDTVVVRQISKSEKRIKKPGKRVSRYGIQYPSLPPSVVKRLAQRFAGKSKISPDTLSAIMQASDWFFEQLGDDLQAYAHHANRETINDSDMLTLMRRYVPANSAFIYTRVSSFCPSYTVHRADRCHNRQRQTSSSATAFALAQRHLPRELLQELKMPTPMPVKAKRRRKQAKAGGEAEDVT